MMSDDLGPVDDPQSMHDIGVDDHALIHSMDDDPLGPDPGGPAHLDVAAPHADPLAADPAHPLDVPAHPLDVPAHALDGSDQHDPNTDVMHVAPEPIASGLPDTNVALIDDPPTDDALHDALAQAHQMGAPPWLVDDMRHMSAIELDGVVHALEIDDPHARAEALLASLTGHSVAELVFGGDDDLDVGPPPIHLGPGDDDDPPVHTPEDPPGDGGVDPVVGDDPDGPGDPQDSIVTIGDDQTSGDGGAYDAGTYESGAGYAGVYFYEYSDENGVFAYDDGSLGADGELLEGDGAGPEDVTLPVLGDDGGGASGDGPGRPPGGSPGGPDGAQVLPTSAITGIAGVAAGVAGAAAAGQGGRRRRRRRRPQ
jgi:hypothetical protein